MNNYICLTSSRTGKLGGGLAFFINQRLKFIRRYDLVVKLTDFEYDVVEVIRNNVNYLVINIYRPPNNAIDDFLKNLQILLDKISKETKTIYITGDFNINLHTSSSAKQFLDLMSSFSLLLTISVPTRTTEQTETTIDNIFSNNLNSFQSGSILIDISDHFPVFTSQIANTKSAKKMNETLYFLNFSEKNIIHLSEALHSQNWEHILSIDDTIMAFNEFLIILLKLIKQFVL